MSVDEVTAFIVDLLEKKRPLPPGVVPADYRFLDQGHVDSLGVMKFIINIEDAFDVEITPAEMESEEFRSVGGLAALIARKRG